jgi:hypothetical protein
MKFVTGPVTIGIDPGLSGAVAFLPHVENILPWVEDMPTMGHSPTGFVKRAVDCRALARMLEPYSMAGTGRVFMERVNAFPGQGVGSMFSLGMSFWGAFGVCAALAMETHLVQPKDWKNHFRLDKDKELARALASRYFPSVVLSRKKDHGRAEALLIARYGKEKHEQPNR